MIRLFVAIALFLNSTAIIAEQIRVAVASNFAAAMKVIAKNFESETGHKVILAFGSTGKHYAQIRNGAPFDIFFAADNHRPKLLEQAGLAVADSRFTYAVGKLVLWSKTKDYVDTDAKILQHGNFHHMAIANPKLAPYGQAAQQILQGRGVWSKLQRRLVRGENISQTFQFVSSGSAELGFVAYSQLKYPGNDAIPGSHWLVPTSLYSPILQQAVLLKDKLLARTFLAYVRSNKILNIIRDYGYDTSYVK